MGGHTLGRMYPTHSMLKTDDPLSTIIQSYADNQDAWLKDFIPTFDKMMSNGYSESALKEAPLSWENVECTKKHFLLSSPKPEDSFISV
jgi:hypothetical protein